MYIKGNKIAVIPADHPGLKHPCWLNSSYCPTPISQACLFCSPTISSLSSTLYWASRKGILNWSVTLIRPSKLFCYLHFRANQLNQSRSSVSAHHPHKQVGSPISVSPSLQPALLLSMKLSH